MDARFAALTKLRAIGDVHGMADWLTRAARAPNRHLILLGDLVDRGPDSAGALRRALGYMARGRATLIRSNHDDRLFRYLRGNNVSIGAELEETLAQIERSRGAAALKRQFLQRYEEEAQDWLVQDDRLFVHGAYHPAMLEFDSLKDITPSKYRGQVKWLAYHGESRQREGQGLPERTYQWVDTIPAGLTVVVGHDVRDMTSPLEVANDEGGRAIFLDTGAGKGGRLSWLDLPEHRFASIGDDDDA